MRKVLVIAAMVIGCSLSAFSWNCSVAGEVRVQVPLSYTGSGTGDGNNQVVEQGGLNFVCEALPTATTTPSTTTNTNTNNSTSGATSGSTSTSGANATGGSVNNSGNSSNKNINTLTNTNTLANTQKQSQGQKQSQTQSNSSVNSNQSAGGNVSDVGNSETTVEAPKIPVSSAYAPPVFSTVNCFKGFSAGGQAGIAGLSFGGGSIDKNCAAERAAQDYFASGNRLAFCKVMVSTKQSKDAGVTFEDCMDVPVRPVMVQAPVAPAPQPIQVTVNVPESKLVYLTVPREEITVTAPKPLGNVRPATKKHTPCKVPASLQVPMEK